MQKQIHGQGLVALYAWRIRCAIWVCFIAVLLLLGAFAFASAPSGPSEPGAASSVHIIAKDSEVWIDDGNGKPIRVKLPAGARIQIIIPGKQPAEDSQEVKGGRIA